MISSVNNETRATAASMPQSDYSIDEEEEEGSYDLFEPGNPWSQKISTQIQRRNWRKSVYLESDEAVPVDDLISQTSAEVERSDDDDDDGDDNDEEKLEKRTPATNTAATAIVIDDEDDNDDGNDEEYLFEASTPKRAIDEMGDRGRTREIRNPWWSNGKTAPLLRDFEGSRRSFYMAQAGISSSAVSSTPAQQREQSATQGSNATPASITATSTSTTTTPDSALRTMTPGSALRPTPLPIRKALSLAGNANSSTPGSLTNIAMTPKKKTWNATWGEKAAQGGNENSAPGHNKKSKVDKSTGKAGTAKRGLQSKGKGKRGRALGVTARPR